MQRDRPMRAAWVTLNSYAEKKKTKEDSMLIACISSLKDKFIWGTQKNSLRQIFCIGGGDGIMGILVS